MLADTSPAPKLGLRWPAMLGAFASIILLAGAAYWAKVTMINGAVIAQGSIVVVGKPKSVQHLDGGIVEEILVSDGDVVAANEVMMRLDSTLLSANLDIYRNRLAEAMTRQSRLRAEQVGSDTIAFDMDTAFLDGVDLDVLQIGQQRVFETRIAVQTGRRAQLSEKINQFRNQIIGVDGLIASKRDQLTFLEQELAAVQTLNEKGLAVESRVLNLQRSRADLLGQISEHQSELARISNSIRDTELEILLAENQSREQVVTELTEVRSSVEELTQQILSTQKQLDRVEIRAPVDGVVHELQIVTIGGVVPPGATIMQIVPRNQGLEFETRVDPASIDEVFVGQDVKLTMTALNQRTTPELAGTVSGISATSVEDPATGIPFFRVQVVVADAELGRIGDVALVPGMPINAFLQTGERSVLSYLTQPMMDHVNKAFREQ
ncbi:HlyD family type I secretion periplasmic adaptor subunit [Yoonia sp. R2-816]|uniref:HlyD family type I secretion periplasmic adaptor subunit n=1 Tax=Yoonia sp. R2-816 TaxID=3342638 RepID=UPI0037278907